MSPKNVFLGLLAGLITSCNATSAEIAFLPKSTDDNLDITVSILPQEYFVRKIALDSVTVNVMVEPGSEPETYEPKPQQLRSLSQADAYITIGVPFEKAWMPKIRDANPDMLVIDSGAGISKRGMVEHEHEHEHEHGEETLDPHIWLSPQLVKIQAENIYRGLVKLDPENQEQYQANLEKFSQEIDELDREIKDTLDEVENRKFIVFHPAWGYFAADYNLEQIPIEVGGQEPSAAELAEIIQEAQQEKIKVVFAQYQFSAQNAQVIAQEIGGKVVFVDPLAPNWSENLQEAAQIFAEVLKNQ